MGTKDISQNIRPYGNIQHERKGWREEHFTRFVPSGSSCPVKYKYINKDLIFRFGVHDRLR